VQSVLNSSAAITGSSLREAFGTSQGTTGTLPGPFGYVGALGYYNDPDLSMPLLSIRHLAMQRGMFVARDRVLSQPRYGYVGGVPAWGVDADGFEPVHGGMYCGEMADAYADLVDVVWRYVREIPGAFGEVAAAGWWACWGRCLGEQALWALTGMMDDAAAACTR